MPRLAANLSFLFTEHAFLDRFAAAAAAGFRGVEFLFPYDHAPEALARALDDAGLEAVLFNLAPGDWQAGERGLAALPGREADFEEALAQAVDYAAALECRRVHVMAGIVPPGADPAPYRATYLRNLARAAERLAPLGASVLIEPINPRDMPGYLFSRQAEAIALLDALCAPNAALQMDLYHCQIVEGDLTTRIRANIGRIGHFQIAGVPERQEPDHGELDIAHLLGTIDALGYDGWVGCEYRPRAATRDGLGWARAYGIGGAPES